MDFLKAEIERKKRQISDKNVLQPEKKYFKRGDLVAVQEQEYLAKYGTKAPEVPPTERFRKPEKKGRNILKSEKSLKLFGYVSFMQLF